MTNLEALQGLIEYGNDKLFEKILLDKGIDGSVEYETGNEKNIDLCLADICLYLITHPEFKEGSQTIKYTASELTAIRNRIMRKYDLLESNVSGEPQW